MPLARVAIIDSKLKLRLELDLLGGIQAWHVGKIDRQDAAFRARQAVLQAEVFRPFLAAPFAGEIVGREHSKKKPGRAQTLPDFAFPIIAGDDRLFIKKMLSGRPE